MFAGEGGPARTNRRFHLLAEGQPATRLSTAFDSVTLYGFDPAERPDIYGKVGNSGVSIATLDDMKVLFDGLRPVRPDHLGVDDHQRAGADDPGDVPEHGDRPAPRAWIPAEVLERVRGTVQADILKEDQGQNTCIFSTEFSLGVMADIAEWFVEHRVRNFYSVSISGYHIAEAGANPISQLAFTLANGFTYVESYLARGLDVDDFAPNLSFFFSNGMDPEYSVLGRVARRIWAIAMRDRYGADERSQKLKYHVQTSGRSLHAQEMAFNDIRTTLQALCAIYDNANSLHTNAYDEAVTTPTAESVRRALAIQLIINHEWGLAMSENPLQGSFIIEELTDLVEAAVLDELDRIDSRGGVLGAMETGYQRGRIQDESMLYEHAQARRLAADHRGQHVPRARGRRGRGASMELARSDDAEKRDQIDRSADFRRRHAAERPEALARLRDGCAGGRQPVRRADGHGAPLHPGRDHRHAVRGRRQVPPQRLRSTTAALELAEHLGVALERALAGRRLAASVGPRSRAARSRASGKISTEAMPGADQRSRVRRGHRVGAQPDLGDDHQHRERGGLQQHQRGALAEVAAPPGRRAAPEGRGRAASAPGRSGTLHHGRRSIRASASRSKLTPLTMKKTGMRNPNPIASSRGVSASFCSGLSASRAIMPAANAPSRLSSPSSAATTTSAVMSSRMMRTGSWVEVDRCRCSISTTAGGCGRVARLATPTARRREDDQQDRLDPRVGAAQQQGDRQDRPELADGAGGGQEARRIASRACPGRAASAAACRWRSSSAPGRSAGWRAPPPRTPGTTPTPRPSDQRDAPPADAPVDRGAAQLREVDLVAGHEEQDRQADLAEAARRTRRPRPSRAPRGR